MAILSLRGYAKHRGVSLKAVQKAIQSGRIHTTAERQIDAERADAEWERNTAPRQRTSGPAPTRPAPTRAPKPVATPDTYIPRAESPVAGGGLDYAKARAIREQYLARLAKIEFEERSAKTISRDEVQVAAFNRFRTFRDGMLNIADRVSAVVAAESDASKVHEILIVEIRKALLEFADSTNG